MPTPFAWPEGRRAAVSLSYDDALPVHREEVAPALEARGLRATFYVPIDSDLLDHRDAWVRIARAGHELGNHTIFHPCPNPGNARSWPLPHRNLCDYDLARWEDEIKVANRILQSYDGRTARSFGNTCHAVAVGPPDAEVPLDEPIARHFVVGRGPGLEHCIDPARAQLTRLGCRTADDRTFDQLRAQIDEAIERGGWLVYCAHGVGRDHRLLWSVDSHEQTLDYLAQRADVVWTAPVADVGQYVRNARMHSP